MSADRRKSLRGYGYIATATFLWGTSATLGRAAFTGRFGSAFLSIDPLILSQSRVSFSFLVFLPALLLRRGWKGLRVPVADLGRMFLLGVFGVAVSNYFYYLAVERTNVATAIIVQYTAPVWVLLYMVARGFQKATLQRVAGVALAVTGIALALGLFSAGGFRLNPVGVGAALLAAVAFATYNIGCHRILTRYDHWIALLYLTLAASLFWLVLNPPWKIAAAHYSAWQWLFLLLFSVLSMLAPFSFYIAALRYLDPTRAIVASCLEPLFSIAIAAIALGEIVRTPQVVGIGLVLGAIVVVQMPDRKTHAPVVIEPME